MNNQELNKFLNQHYSYLHSLSYHELKWFRKQVSHIINNKYENHQKYNVPVDQRIWQSVKELKKFISEESNPRHRLAWELLAWTGVRSNELKSVGFKDFDYDEECMKIMSSKKHYNHYEVKPLPSKLCEKIKYFCDFNQARLKMPFSFNFRKSFRSLCNQVGGKYTEYYARRSGDGAKLYNFSTHSFRKWFATLIESRGFGHIAIGDSRRVAEKCYIGRVSRIRNIINKLY